MEYAAVCARCGQLGKPVGSRDTARYRKRNHDCTGEIRIKGVAVDR